jgi:hydrogenase-4 component B
VPLAIGLDAGAGSLLVAIAALLVLATLAALAPRSVLNPRGLSFALSALASVGFLVLGIAVIVSGGSVTASAGQVLGFAAIDVRYDGLAGAFLVALGIGGAAASVYGIGHAARADRPIDRTRAAYPVFLASLSLVFGAADAFAFLLAWELMALSSALLVVGASPTIKVARAGYLYLVVTHLATAAIVVAFAILASAAGSTAFAAFGPAAATLSPAGRDLVFVMLLVGFGTKAGAIPLHIWLPRAHPVAPSHLSALMSAVMIKAGIYGIIRFGLDLLGPGPEWWGLLVIVIGAVSAVLGILYALMEHDLKRLLAFSSIENIGIILIAVGVALLATSAGLTALAGLALTAALFHTINHAVFKSLLFLGAGSIQSAAGTRDLNMLGGLARAMPVTTLAFAVGAAAISGLPPLNGFAGEWLTFVALLGAASEPALSLLARSTALAAIAALGLTAALAVACFVKAIGIGLLALPRSPGAAGAAETAPSMRLAQAALALACVGLGLAAGPVAGVLARIATSISGAAVVPTASAFPTVPGLDVAYAAAPLGLLIAILAVLIWLVSSRGRVTRRVPTWIGGQVPEPAFEYTASSYSKLIRVYYGPVLRPAREVSVELHPGTPFPRTVRYRGHARHLLDERLYGPLHRLAVTAARQINRLQSGSLQVYLAYSVAALVALLLLAR